ncbi:MAG: tetratricopeptide repeat protein [Deltaproteobacteria bacterium]|nr:tetratricopeptide repeat protein [Deltaproteobacteria bacterium]
MHTRPWLAVTFASFLSSAGTARAQDLPPGAQAHFDRAVELADAADYERALAEFERAAAIRETPKVVYNVASCLRALGRHALALAAFERVMQLDAGSLPPASRDNLARYIAELRSEVALLSVRTNVPDAALTVDGHPLVHQPHPVEPGDEIVVVARRAGYRQARTTARPRAPGPFEVSLALEPEPAVPEPSVQRDEEAGRPPAWSPWIAMGVAVAAAGAGAFFGSRVLDRDAAEDEADSAATGATVSFSVAGAAAASGVGLWIWRQ